jgi:hypothetical protein
MIPTQKTVETAAPWIHLRRTHRAWKTPRCHSPFTTVPTASATGDIKKESY